MFCEIERVELRIDTCPVRCMYKAANGKCSFTKLSDEDVDVITISQLTGRKVYKLKAQASSAKQMIEIGLAIDRYCDYIRDTVPKAHEQTMNVKSMAFRVLNSNLSAEAEAVNGIESSSGVASRLKRVFNLTPNQQEAFWSESKFLNWSKRSGSSVTLRDMRQALISI
jgi:paraquat-inducible protein B